jgi:aminoglycoside phosphotransferase family enzyme
MGMSLSSKSSSISKSPFPASPSTAAPSNRRTHHYYEIENKQQTASALLLFAQHRETKERVVIKILRDYKVTRYSLLTSQERLQYQLEALYWNKKFAPGVYKGLACILGWSKDPNSIVIGEIIENPCKEMHCPNAEYALVMHELPTDRRLDLILNKEDELSLQTHIRLLTTYVAYIHTKVVEPPIPGTGNSMWGSFQQVQEKLEENLKLLDLVLIISEKDTSDSSTLLIDTFWQMVPQGWYRRYLEHHIKHRHGDLRFSKRLRDILNPLKENLRQVFREKPYQKYLEQRIKEHRIKHCHGDLKTPHMWIIPYNYLSDTEPWEYVRVIDAIDFNPTYCNIDILSDLAMLVIDIQARTQSPELANLMTESYLELTNQKDEVSRLVLAYYLVEKAIMWAAVSIVYDDLPELGLIFLKIAEQRMKDLMDQDIIWRADTLIGIPALTSLLAYHSKRNHSG